MADYKKKYKVGDLYAIPDGKYGWYFGCIGAGRDVLFIDEFNSNPEYFPSGPNFFLRLIVNFPSMNRARWKKIGSLPIEGKIASFSRYKYQPVGDYVRIWDCEQAREIPDQDGEADSLEHWAVWDAVSHITPILRYHFHRIETPFIEGVRTPL